MRKPTALVIFAQILKDDQLQNDMIKTLVQSVDGAIEIKTGSIADMEFLLDGANTYLKFGDHDLRQADTVYIRGASGVSEQLSAITNRFSDMNWLQTLRYGNRHGKLNQYAVFDRDGLPFPRTAVVTGGDPQARAKRLGELLGWPIVAKSNMGTHGDDVNLAHNEVELATILASEDKWRYVCQAYLANDRDYRVVVVEDEVKVVVERKRQAGTTEWRNNVSLGADRQILDLTTVPQELIDIAIKATKSIDYRLAGVDIMLTDLGYKILEINNQPDFNPGTSEAITQFVIDETISSARTKAESKR